MRGALLATLACVANGLFKHLDVDALNGYVGGQMALFVRFHWSATEAKTAADQKEWTKVGKNFKTSKRVLIGNLDCSKYEGQHMCQHVKKDVASLLFWQPGQAQSSEYGGDQKVRTAAKLISFAKEQLGPPCGPRHIYRCTEQESYVLFQYGMSSEKELTALFEKGKAELLAAQKTSPKALQEARERIEPGLKLVKTARDHKREIPPGVDVDVWAPTDAEMEVAEAHRKSFEELVKAAEELKEKTENEAEEDAKEKEEL